ncbi:MAG: UDP-N-acetylglucosamine 1-carboxyvinyltransferase [Caldisericaceae bacterium]
MEYFAIEGGQSLKGSVRISGAKNAVFPIVSAALLIKDKIHIRNIPEILDVSNFFDILRELGAKIEKVSDGYTFDFSGKISDKVPFDENKSLRGTQTLLGALVARNKKASLPSLGGCNIGSRPIELHLKGMEAFGVKFGWEKGYLNASVRGNLRGEKIYLDFPSVGATENLIIASCLASGDTVIENAAKEPEIKDLVNFLNSAGAKIEMNGSGVIKIHGVKELQKTSYTIIPDRIEASTYLILGAITQGEVTLTNVNSHDFEPVIMKLKEMGAVIEDSGSSVSIKNSGILKSVNVKTLPFPGFPTDAQPQIMSLLSIAKGTSIISETIFENRFRAAEELIKMGANIKLEGNTAIVTGVQSLRPAEVIAPDLRGGVSLVLAALSAKGKSKVFEPFHIDRGYEKIVEKIVELGGKIERKST